MPHSGDPRGDKEMWQVRLGMMLMEEEGRQLAQIGLRCPGKGAIVRQKSVETLYETDPKFMVARDCVGWPNLPLLDDTLFISLSGRDSRSRGNNISRI